MNNQCSRCKFWLLPKEGGSLGQCRRHSPTNHVYGHAFMDGSLYPEAIEALSKGNVIVPYTGDVAPTPILITGWPRTKPADYCGDFELR